MNDADLQRVNYLLIDLLSELEKEAGKLQAEYDNSSMRIREIDENIYNYKENEDVDIQVFSPRKLDNKNEVRLDSLNREKDVAQTSVKDISKQMKYYNDKIKKLKEIKNIINQDESDDKGNLHTDNIEDVFNIDEKIKSEAEFQSSEADEANQSIDNSVLISNLNRISHKADIGYKIVDNDVFRAKMEFKSIKSGLEDLIGLLLI